MGSQDDKEKKSSDIVKRSKDWFIAGVDCPWFARLGHGCIAYRELVSGAIVLNFLPDPHRQVLQRF